MTERAAVHGHDRMQTFGNSVKALQARDNGSTP